MPATVTTDRVRVAGVDIVLANIVMSGAKILYLKILPLLGTKSLKNIAHPGNSVKIRPLSF